MKFAVCLFALVAAVVAEPPVPSNLYLPAYNGAPSSSYGAPSSSYGAPSNGFGQNGGGQRPSPQYRAPNTQYGAPNGGEESAPASYQFEYAVDDAESGNDFGHQESREGDFAQGKYYVLLPDGRKQVVVYTADNEGYKPMITYEEGNGGYSRNGGNGGGYPRYNGNGNHNGNGGYNY